LVLKNQKRINTQTGKPLSFELLLSSGGNDQWVLPFKQNLARLGITMNIRQVDNAQITNRMRSRDYDMMQRLWSAQPWPSSDLQISWASSYINSSYNAPGVKSPVMMRIAKIGGRGDTSCYLRGRQGLNLELLHAADVVYGRRPRGPMEQILRARRAPHLLLGFDNWWYDVNKAAKLPAERR
jgi:microcin C transport system substrate-binding protein